MSTPEYVHLRPAIGQAYGYSHAVRIGADIKISGAVGMDDEGNSTAICDIEQQIRNVYTDLRQILDHYGCTFDDVIVENVFTTDMAGFLEASAYRATIYTAQFPAGRADAMAALIERTPGTRPLRTVVGLDVGVRARNESDAPHDAAVLEAFGTTDFATLAPVRA